MEDRCLDAVRAYWKGEEGTLPIWRAGSRLPPASATSVAASRAHGARRIHAGTTSFRTTTNTIGTTIEMAGARTTGMWNNERRGSERRSSNPHFRERIQCRCSCSEQFDNPSCIRLRGLTPTADSSRCRYGCFGARVPVPVAAFAVRCPRGEPTFAPPPGKGRTRRFQTFPPLPRNGEVNASAGSGRFSRRAPRNRTERHFTVRRMIGAGRPLVH